MRNKFVILALFVICHLSFVIYSFADAKEYDGIWFLGFNLQQAPFDNLKVRQAVAHTLDKDYIAFGIMSEEATPISFIPPGMPGYDGLLTPYKNNIAYAKTLMKRAKYSPADARLKELTLLHTDGVKTIEIAREIKQDLQALGMKVRLVQVKYRDEEKWQSELSSGKYSLFLMGYKANSNDAFAEDLASYEVRPKIPDSTSLLEPLFKTKGSANFSGFSNSSADMLFDQLSVISTSLNSDRAAKLKEINRILYKQLPVVVLFYIEKL